MTETGKEPPGDGRVNLATLNRLWQDVYGSNRAFNENSGRMAAWSLGGWFVPGALWYRHHIRPDLFRNGPISLYLTAQPGFENLYYDL